MYIKTGSDANINYNKNITISIITIEKRKIIK